MRILYLNTFSTVHGGAERLLFDTSIEMIQRGHDVSIVVANDDRRSPNPEFWPGRINRYYVPELIVPQTDRYNWEKYRKSGGYLETIRYLQDILDIERPDLIHVHNFPNVEVLKEVRYDGPIIRTIHSYENLCENRLKRLPDGSLCTKPLGQACQTQCGHARTFKTSRVEAENRFMKKRFNRLLAISSYIKEVLVINGFRSSQVQVLPNFTRLTPKNLGVQEENLVLYVGRLTPEKGLQELLQSLSLIENRPKLLIVGKDGVLGQSSFQEQVLREIRERGIDAEILGWLAGDDLRAVYARAKVVAFSSVWPEPFGLVGIEAMMQGKPVVAFDAGGVRDWLYNGETGHLVPHLDLEQYAARIDQLLSNDNQRRAMGARAQQIALSSFCPEAYMTRLLDTYKEVVHESSLDRSRRSAAVCDAQCGTGVPLERVAHAGA